MKRFWNKLIVYVRWGKITAHVIATTGYRTPTEIEYRDRWGRTIGLWVCGDWHPDYPFCG